MTRISPARSIPGLACALFAAAALVPATTPAQSTKRPLNHGDYDDWKSLSGRAISLDGKWVAYGISPAWGDGELVVRQIDGDAVYRHALGSRPVFAQNGKYLIFSIGKSKVEDRRKRLKELREKGRASEPSSGGASGGSMQARMAQRFGRRGPGGRRGGGGGGSGGRGDLAIMDLGTGSVEVIKRVKGYRVLEDESTLIYHLDKPEEKKDDGKESDGDKKKEEGAETEEPPREQRGERRGRRAGRGNMSAEQRAAMRERMGRGRGGRGGRSEGSAEDPLDKYRKEGTDLVVRDLNSGDEQRHENVASYGLTGEQKWLYMHVSEKKQETKKTNGDQDESGDGDAKAEAAEKKKAPVVHGLFAVKLADGSKSTILEGIADFSGFTTDRDKKVMAFTSNLEDVRATAARHAEEQAKRAKEEKEKESKEKEKGEKAKGEKKAVEEEKVADKDDSSDDEDEKTKRDIYLWEMSAKPARRVVHSKTAGMPDEKKISGGVSFSRDGSVLRFSIQAERDELPKILPEEKVVLDLWHWNDGKIQPQQAKSRGGSNPSLTAVYHRDDDRVVVLGDEQIPSMSLITPDGSRALATDGKPYEKMITWDGRYSDVYIVNTIDGTRTKVLEKLRGSARSSPNGKYLVYFDADYHWYSVDIECMKKRNLTDGLGIPFDRHDDDHPNPNPAYGVAGWTKDDQHVVIYDEFDMWRINPHDGETVNVTDGMGRANNIRFRWMRIDLDDSDDDEDRDYMPDTLWLTASNTETMDEGVYEDSLVAVRKPKRLTWMSKNIGGITKAKKADRLFFTIETFREYPDLWTSAMDFSGMTKLTDVNPQQKNVRWGDAELVRWVNSDGRELKGILIKPEGFDPDKKYPMMVHFYEKMSSRLYRYSRPSPGTSPNAAYYVSNGYLWFMPDIVYDEGYPGDSCLKCVVSGVQSIIGRGFVDEKAIGAAGHSWGGYQTAYLVTRSDIFACVESGAPVSNMFSAYGGIRYQSGMSRQFQYEMTQSRIGGTPWQYPMRYWENSPIFFADKVNTPVLILHNDQDGAVPWTNGIEYFMALRRLGNEAYLFNYVGEPHGIRKRQNQKDWTRRMAEFFDHHLKGRKAPNWMSDGVPYGERDREKMQWVPSLLEASVAPPAAASNGSGENDR